PRPAPLVLRHRACPLDGGVCGTVSRRSAPAKERRVGRRRGVLSDAPERGKLLALLVVGEPRPRRRQRACLLCGVPAAGDRRVTRGLAAAAALTLAVVTALNGLTGGGPASVLRHGFLLPVVALALAFGRLGGALGTGAALGLYAPVVLLEIERSGLTPETIEGLVTCAVVAGVGALGGALTTRARRQRARYETILTVQRALAGAAPLARALGRLRTVLIDRLRAADVGLVVRDGAREVVAGGDRGAAGSVAAGVLTVGTSVFVPDAGEGRGPGRVVATPRRVAGAGGAGWAGAVGAMARRCGRIVSGLLDLSRIERGLEPTLHRVPVAVEAALVATADLFRRGVADTIVVDCAPALPPVDADPDA